MLFWRQCSFESDRKHSDAKFARIDFILHYKWRILGLKLWVESQNINKSLKVMNVGSFLYATFPGHCLR
jgi:hypothetical protein